MLILGDVLLIAVLVYFVAGFAFAFRFATRLAGAVNERARVGSPLFRLFLLPGAMLLWPWLWRRESHSEDETGAASEGGAE